MTSEQPLSHRFFPASRIGLAFGLLVGFGGAALLSPSQKSVEPDVVSYTSADPARVVAAHGIPGPAIVNVWLENCRDCMPAFEAWNHFVVDQRIAGEIGKDARVYNVAYGSASNAFARTYTVDDNLSFDAGDRFVRPLGISSFTTLVLDKDGKVVHRDRPDHSGYLERMHRAWQAIH